MKKQSDSIAEIIQFGPEQSGALGVARKRITPIVRAWAAYPSISNLDIFWLALSCYMQGTVDGYGAAEQNRKSEGSN